MDKEGAPDKTQKGKCTRGGGKQNKLNFLCKSQLFLLLENLPALFFSFYISTISSPLKSKQGKSNFLSKRIYKHVYDISFNVYHIFLFIVFLYDLHM